MNSIPTYALYGERSDQPEFLHWETIPARSRLHGFHIGQHRHENLLQVLRLDAGGARARLDDLSAELAPGDLVLVPAMAVHEYHFSDDVDGIVLTLFETDVRALGFAFDRPIVLRNALKVGEVIDTIIDETRAPAFNHQAVLSALLTLLFSYLQRESVRDAAVPQQTHRAHALVRSFRDQVERDYRKIRSVAPYADRLGISHTHLNRVCHTVLATSAQDVINRRLATEARRYLLFSDLPVKVVAAELGFDDPAYFTRFITRHLGRSPLSVRAERYNPAPKI